MKVVKFTFLFRLTLDGSGSSSRLQVRFYSVTDSIEIHSFYMLSDEATKLVWGRKLLFAVGHGSLPRFAEPDQWGCCHVGGFGQRVDEDWRRVAGSSDGDCPEQGIEAENADHDCVPEWGPADWGRCPNAGGSLPGKQLRVSDRFTRQNGRSSDGGAVQVSAVWDGMGKLFRSIRIEFLKQHIELKCQVN